MKFASQWTYKILVWFGIVPNQRYTIYGMVQYRMPTRDNWIVESSTVFTKARRNNEDQLCRLLRPML